jgi:hypothetical protein
MSRPSTFSPPASTHQNEADANLVQTGRLDLPARQSAGPRQPAGRLPDQRGTAGERPRWHLHQWNPASL